MQGNKPNMVTNMISKRIDSECLSAYPVQSFHEARKRSRKRQVILYGAGKACIDFLDHYESRFDIKGVADKSEDKQGTFVRGTRGKTEYPVRWIGQFGREEMGNTVFIVTPVSNVCEIMEELQKKGAKWIFSYYLMEATNPFFYLKYAGKMQADRNRRWWKAFQEETFGLSEYYKYGRKLCKKYSRLPVEKDKIVFLSFGGQGYQDHGKYITEMLLRKNVPCQIVWLALNMETEVPSGVRLVDYADWEKAFYEMETAGIWVSNAELPGFLVKRKGQTFIQTKHWTSITLKKFYFDAKTICRDPERKRIWKKNSRMIDYIITGSKFDTRTAKSGFRPRGTCLEIGSPRVDPLFQPEVYGRIAREKLGLPEDAKILLYAPTYRFNWDVKACSLAMPGYTLDYEGLYKVLQEKFPGDWYICIRLHPAIKNEDMGIQFSDVLRNVSDYDDIQELLAAADVLVTDYSSLMFEPAFAHRPVFLYATDLEHYIQSEYELLLDMRELPFLLAQDNAELFAGIRQFRQEEYQAKLEGFLDRFQVLEDGHASERAAEFIQTLIERKKV